jgi:hypothetical protein
LLSLLFFSLSFSPSLSLVLSCISLHFRVFYFVQFSFLSILISLVAFFCFSLLLTLLYSHYFSLILISFLLIFVPPPAFSYSIIVFLSSYSLSLVPMIFFYLRNN